MNKKKWIVFASVICNMCLVLGTLRFIYRPAETKQNKKVAKIKKTAAKSTKRNFSFFSEDVKKGFPKPAPHTLIIETKADVKRNVLLGKAIGDVL